MLVTIIGYVGSTIIAEPIRRYFNRLLDRAPLLKTTYTALSDFLSTIVGKRKSFSHPVLIKMDRNSDVERLGFVTEEDLTQLGLPEGKVAIYLPFSYSFSGNLIILPVANVTPIDAKSADIMKFIVSGGVAHIEKEW